MNMFLDSAKMFGKGAIDSSKGMSGGLFGAGVGGAIPGALMGGLGELFGGEEEEEVQSPRIQTGSRIRSFYEKERRRRQREARA